MDRRMSAMARQLRFGLWYDLRNPANTHRSSESFYAESLDQIAWA